MRRRILITGATSGIGLALARRLGKDADLLLTGRRAASGIRPEFPPGAAYAFADQGDPQSACDAVCAAFGKLGWDRIDLAVLNAGAGFAVDPVNETTEIVRATLDANVVSPMMLAHALFPFLLAANGRLALIGSTAYRGASGFAAYAASKAALDGFGRALAEEWRGRVTVQVIHPGPTATGMHARAGYDAGRRERLFISPDAMARMIERITTGNRPVTVASYARFLLGSHWLGAGG